MPMGPRAGSKPAGSAEKATLSTPPVTGVSCAKVPRGTSHRPTAAALVSIRPRRVTSTPEIVTRLFILHFPWRCFVVPHRSHHLIGLSVMPIAATVKQPHSKQPIARIGAAQSLRSLCSRHHWRDPLPERPAAFWGGPDRRPPFADAFAFRDPSSPGRISGGPSPCASGST